jgi:hypothetical protein
MTYKQIKNLREKEFKRLCGVKPKLFDEMVEVLKQELPQPKQKGGQPKLEVEDQLLMALFILEGVPNVLSHRSVMGSS